MTNHQPPVELPEGYVEFFRDLENWQNEESIKLKQVYQPARQDIFKALEQNKHALLQQVNPGIDSQKLRDTYMRFLTWLQKARPAISGEIARLIDQAEAFDFEEVAASFSKGSHEYFTELSEKAGVSYELLFFTIDHALRPYLRIFAASYGEDLPEAEGLPWDFPANCPVCGAKSHFCHLTNEEGHRLMFCDRCFSQWWIRYIFCPYCGNDKPGDIGYISVDNHTSPYKVYVCENCKGYIKTYDERDGAEPTDLYIANIETIYLDMLAQEKGYTNHDE